MAQKLPTVKSNPVAPSVSIVLGGKERHFKYDLNSLVMIEEELGVDIFKGGLDMSSVKSVRYLIYTGLLHEDPELTVQDVGAMIEISAMATVGEAIREALGFSMPEVEVPAEGEEATTEDGEADPNAPTPIRPSIG